MKRLFNIKNSLISFLTFLLIFSLSVKSYAIEKPTYTKWIRELYDYDESVSDEKIIEEKVFEDETGRVFYKQPSSLTYDTWDGKAGIIAIIEGFNIGEGDGANYYHEDEANLTRYYSALFDLSQYDLTFNPNNSNIIYYSQRGNNASYGNSTIAKGGCGPTSLAMIVDSLTNANIGVTGMARFAEANGYRADGLGSYWSLFTKGAKQFGLSVNTIHRSDAASISRALGAGHPVAMSCHAGDFTKGGHFIVLTGIDANGNVTVNDPNSVERSQRTWTLSQIMANASTKGGGYSMWEIYKG